MNPLMNAIGGNSNTGNQNPNIMNIFQMLKNGNPEQIAMNLMQRNPQFRQFVEANKGKSPEQVAKENGVDLAQIMRRFG